MTTIILTVLGLFITAALTVWATLKADRRERRMERERQDAARQQDQEQHLRQVQNLLQTMVVEKIEVAFSEIEKLQKAVGAVKEAHAHLKGFLQGKGCLVPEFCADDLKESGS